MKIDLRWKIPQKNQLWLRWKSVTKEGDGTIKLIGAEFFGPVLQDCVAIEPAGSIRLDLTKHLIIITPQPYLINVKWDALVSQDSEKAVFKELVLEDSALGLLNRLTARDLILIDCTGHTTEQEAKGRFMAAFSAMIYKETMEPYDFD
jgi:hypothetical protein